MNKNTLKYAHGNWSDGSLNDLMPSGTMPLPETMLRQRMTSLYLIGVMEVDDMMLVNIIS